MRGILFLPLLFYFSGFAFAAPKTKLCANPSCTTPFFTSTITRTINAQNSDFLSPNMNDEVSILSFKYSDRPDLFTAQLKDGSIGNLLDGMINRGDYANFLYKSIMEKREFFIVSHGDEQAKVIGKLAAEFELVRDYNVQASRFSQETNTTLPPQLPIPEALSSKGHGHSHGQGHSHGPGDAHGHSHEAHGHSHEADATTLNAAPHIETATQPPPKIAATPAAVTPAPATTHIHAADAQPAAQVTPPPVVHQPAQPSPVATSETSPPTTPPSTPIAANAPPTAKVAPEFEQKFSEAEIGTDARLNAATETQPADLPTLTESIPDIVHDMPKPTEDAASAPVTETLNPVEVPTEVPTIAPITQPSPLTASNPNIIPTVESTTPIPIQTTTTTTTSAPVQAEEQQIPNEPTVNNYVTDSAYQEGFCEGDDCEKIKPLPTAETTVDDFFSTASPIEEKPITTSQTSAQFLEDSGSTEFARVDNLQPELATEAENSQTIQVTTESPVQPLPEAQAEAGLPPPPSGPGFLARTISTIAGLFRSIPGMSELSDGAIGIVLNITILLITVVTWFIGTLLSDSDSISFERRAAHDLATTIKTLQVKMKEKDEELHRLRQVGGSDSQMMQTLRAEHSSLSERVQHLQQRLAVVEPDLRRESEARVLLEQDLARERALVSELRQKEAELTRLSQSAQEHASSLNIELTASTARVAQLEASTNELRHQKEQISGDLNVAKTRVEELNNTLRTTSEELQKEKLAREDCEVQSVEYQQMLVDLQSQLASVTAASNIQAEQKTAASTNEVQSTSSGSGAGSNGWSDFEDFDVPDDKEKDKKVQKTKKETTPVASRAAPIVAAVGDIQEVARLRGEIKRLELKVASSKNELEKECVIKQSLEQRIEHLEQIVKQKSAELDKSEVERHQAFEQSSKLLKMLEAAQTKYSDTETSVSTLRSEIRKLQDDARVLEDECRKKEYQQKEVEDELKKLRNEHLKLETKHFNLSREHRNLVDQRALGGGSSDLLPPNDRIGSGSRQGGLLTGIGESTWDEPPLPPAMHANHSHRLGSSPEDFDLGMPPQMRRSSRSRRSERRESPSDAERSRRSLHGQREPPSPGHRRRSRSQGRHPFNHDYLAMGPPRGVPLLLPERRPMSHVGNAGTIGMGGHVYYSSGGSNSGRSPPPEMVHQAAVPPAGLHKPKGTRPVDLNAAFK